MKVGQKTLLSLGEGIGLSIEVVEVSIYGDIMPVGLTNEGLGAVSVLLAKDGLSVPFTDAKDRRIAELEAENKRLTIDNRLLLILAESAVGEATLKLNRVTKQGFMKEVQSSNIKAIGYNLETKTLFVHFHSGDKYQYHQVEESIWTAFESAQSAGKFHNQCIKGLFKYTKEDL